MKLSTQIKQALKAQGITSSVKTCAGLTTQGIWIKVADSDKQATQQIAKAFEAQAEFIFIN